MSRTTREREKKKDIVREIRTHACTQAHTHSHAHKDQRTSALAKRTDPFRNVKTRYSEIISKGNLFENVRRFYGHNTCKDPSVPSEALPFLASLAQVFDGTRR